MHVDPTPQDAPRPDVDAPTLHAAYAPPIGYTLLGVDYAHGNDRSVKSPAPSPTNDEGPEDLP